MSSVRESAPTARASAIVDGAFGSGERPLKRQSAPFGYCLNRYQRTRRANLCYQLPMHAAQASRHLLPGITLAALLCLHPPMAFAGPVEDVGDATRAWAAAYNTRDPKQIVALYAPDAVFWGTSSPTLRDTPALIAEYFASAPNSPNGRVEIGDLRVRVWGDIAASTGSYTFTDVRNGETIRRPARFSFMFRRTNGRWMIVDHHSSSVPAATR
jgi:uncharacterized protein (TIGR02246 family)